MFFTVVTSSKYLVLDAALHKAMIKININENNNIEVLIINSFIF